MDKLKPLLAKMAKADRDLILFLAARVAKKARRQEPNPDNTVSKHRHAA